MNIVEELKWRGLVHDITPGTEEYLEANKPVAGYCGFDPTAKSLTIGNLVPLMMLVHFQQAGHKPVALAGGATGMIGDPSGKDEERKLLSADELEDNTQRIEKQLSKFLDFESKTNAALLVNNMKWFEGMNLFDFLRNIGKHMTVSYMLSKESVKKRLEGGLSFAEFAYQVLQAEDFYQLHNEPYNCMLQLGGSDQWGNIVSGIELIRKKGAGEAYAITCPLITKADGGKFGKTEDGSVWLDPEMTSPYKFYQFWLNCSDEDAAKYIRIFTLLGKDEIEQLITDHEGKAHERNLQKTLAKNITTAVHSAKDYELALKASEILFGNATKEALEAITEEELLTICEGVPQKKLSRNDIEAGIGIIPFLTEKTEIFPSKGEVKRSLQEGGIRINKEKVTGADVNLNKDSLLNDKYILVQKGKKHYFLVIAE